ncbi:DUF481 domain-containing protein [Aliarcobacter skirrowii]|uniref:DUF481 domain-containing protein n=1 Tax=Aliarcobacter skirrowii TaxID=28200 RepID=UPI000D61DBF5|nr:DUF481 domain-containing protein [Aliarcobacter skirrowii]PWE19253.1 DUF481 domain-containing protein [Aliarcobacter skirrowii]PWE25895.1 DUF481 domain-containing protein [Aliarcobacter skirrowii]RJO55300.1 DUF481 domain-containing protein [Aliarcobacter skirrowii]RJO57065.1 DUF481 domain-containing protein [Aliarcobacter skirrowii]
MIKNHKKLLILPILLNFATAVENEGKVELSYVNTSGNTQTTTLAADAEVKSKIDDIELKFKGSIIKSKDNNEESANKYELELQSSYMFTDNFYTYLGVNYVKDEFSDYDSRLNIGPGLGYKFINTDDHLLDIKTGVDYSLDKYENGKKNEYAASKSELNYKYQIKEDVEFKQMVNYLVSMEDSEKYFVTSESSVNVKMVGNLSLGVSYKVDYTNQTQKEKTDKKFLTSLIYDF